MPEDMKIRKQISISVPFDDWKAIQMEAATRRIAMTELCREWMGPWLKKLRDKSVND